MKALASLFFVSFVGLVVIMSAACTEATDTTAKLPSCAEVGCPGTVLCSGKEGSCSCVAAPGDSPIACERNSGVDSDMDAGVGG